MSRAAVPTQDKIPRRRPKSNRKEPHVMSADANHGKQHEVLTIAEERGLLAGSRTHIVRGRMPVGLVEQAKRKSGISSDSKLLELALATLAVSDDYAQWLLAQRATVNPEIDLEF